jgi:hypothetical protein
LHEFGVAPLFGALEDTLDDFAVHLDGQVNQAGQGLVEKTPIRRSNTAPPFD